MSELSYSKHYETLMAVVTHLAVNKWALRQPRGIANDLSIDESSGSDGAQDIQEPVPRIDENIERSRRSLLLTSPETFETVDRRERRRARRDQVGKFLQ